jgi:two-component system osmolarity sensor histidine kinase EnvZ
VPPEQLASLTSPSSAATRAHRAAGAGLGLSIVDKTVQRMGGMLSLANAPGGGLAAHVQLQRAASGADSDTPQRLQRPQVKRQLPPRRRSTDRLDEAEDLGDD